MTFARNTRVHPDTIIPLAPAVLETTNGAVALTRPVGASGIMFQSLTANTSYWSTTAMTAPLQGFSIRTSRQVIWFNPSGVAAVHLWLHDDDTVIYQWVAPVAY